MESVFSSSNTTRAWDNVGGEVTQSDVQANVANESLIFDERWEPPTREEWRRALQAIALHAARQILGKGAGVCMTRLVSAPITWH